MVKTTTLVVMLTIDIDISNNDIMANLWKILLTNKFISKLIRYL